MQRVERVVSLVRQNLTKQLTNLTQGVCVWKDLKGRESTVL